MAALDDLKAVALRVKAGNDRVLALVGAVHADPTAVSAADVEAVVADLTVVAEAQDAVAPPPLVPSA